MSNNLCIRVGRENATMQVNSMKSGSPQFNCQQQNISSITVYKIPIRYIFIL